MISKREITVPFRKNGTFDMKGILCFLQEKIPELKNMTEIQEAKLKKMIRTVHFNYNKKWLKFNKTSERFFNDESVKNFLDSEFQVSDFYFS